MYFPLRCHSHYSLLLSTLTADAIIEHAKRNEYPAIGLTDFTTISGAIDFYESCKKAKIKPILGCELLISGDSNESSATITVLCKNLKGWRTLLRIISKSNDPENLVVYPTISLEQLMEFDLSNFICIDGYDGSMFHYSLFKKNYKSFFIDCYEELSEELREDWIDTASKHVGLMKEMFNDYYLESTVEECCSSTNPLPLLLAECVYSLRSKIDFEQVTDNSVYYADNIGAIDQRILLCAKLRCTISNLSRKVQEVGLLKNRLNIFLKSTFFKFNRLPESSHQKIYDLCEEYDILSQPKLPSFTCPNGQGEMEYLRQLCRDGWKNILVPSGVITDQEKQNEYRDRVLMELSVIERASLAGYFLIVQDYVNEFRNRGYLVGPGRGSVGGSLVAYLTGITLVDPIEYGLLFSRFYDSSRVVAGKVSLPDIDVDFPPECRDDVVEYLKEKYGHDKVAQIATYGRLQGKSALKEVLRVNEYCSFEQMNNITSVLPNEGAISDQLEEMEEHSIIMWALEHDADKLRDYCYIKDGELHGDYSRAFQQAIRLEGIFRNLGKHACAVIISSEPLQDYCPLVLTARSKEKQIGYDMHCVEKAGGVKADILGLSALSKIQHTLY